MRKFLLFTLILLLPLGATASPLPDTMVLEGQQLQRVSTAPAYYAGLFHIYDAALYTARNKPDQYLTAPYCLTLSYRVAISRAQLIEAAEKTLASQGYNLQSMRPQLKQLHSHYRDVSRGDRFTLCQLTGRSTELRFNGKSLVTLTDAMFGQRYLGIWLGDNPLSSPLRDTLLHATRIATND